MASPKPDPKTELLTRARAMIPLLVADEEVDLPDAGARLLVAVLYAEHGGLGSFDEVKAAGLHLKHTAPMVWGAVRRGNTMPLPKYLKMYHRPAKTADEYRRMMMDLSPPDPPPARRPPLVESDESRAARMLPPDVKLQLDDARREARAG